MTDSFATEPASMTAATTTACVAAGGTQSVDDTDRSSEQTRQPAPGARKGPLLSGLGDSSSQSRAPASGGTKSSKKVDHQAFDNHLAMVRLGIATSLFYALRCKHTPTAAHSLRVALVSSAWCQRLGLEASARDRIEVAALLHDIGKIGIPDRILRKPAKLSDEEQLTMQCCPELAGEILRGCTSDKELLSIVRHAGTWYQGRRHHDGPVGDALPMGSRMLSIVGAFDAMTTNQVYRRAMSRERALKELFHGCGTQFDPELTHDFVSMLEDRPELLHHRVIHRWLQNLDGGDDSFLFGRQSASAHSTASTHNNSESQNAARQNEASGMMRLTEGSKAPSTSSSSIPDRVSRFDAYFEIWSRQSRDGVVFTDGDGQVVFWNDSMTRLTGITTEAIVGTQWDCETIGLQPRLPVQTTDDDAPETSADDEVHLSCPVQECLQRRTTVPKTMRLRRRSTSGQEKPRDVWVQASPVSDARAQGVVLEIADMSDRTELEQQIESLHVRAASDPLTGVANRAELDRQLDEITCRAQQGEGSFSLIICDI
ncbi:MAG: HD domain-containing phosphohydrolase, partial [Planctomycetota bacterium]